MAHFMSGFIVGESRYQTTLFPEALDEYIQEDNPVRVVDVFVDDLDLAVLVSKSNPPIPADRLTILV